MRRDFQRSLPHGRFRTEASPMRSVLSSPVTYAPPKSLQRTVHTHAKRGQRPNEDQPPRCTARMQLGENLVVVAPPAMPRAYAAAAPVRDSFTAAFCQ